MLESRYTQAKKAIYSSYASLLCNDFKNTVYSTHFSKRTHYSKPCALHVPCKRAYRIDYCIKKDTLKICKVLYSRVASKYSLAYKKSKRSLAYESHSILAYYDTREAPKSEDSLVDAHTAQGILEHTRAHSPQKFPEHTAPNVPETFSTNSQTFWYTRNFTALA